MSKAYNYLVSQIKILAQEQGVDVNALRALTGDERQKAKDALADQLYTVLAKADDQGKGQGIVRFDMAGEYKDMFTNFIESVLFDDKDVQAVVKQEVTQAHSDGRAAFKRAIAPVPKPSLLGMLVSAFAVQSLFLAQPAHALDCAAVVNSNLCCVDSSTGVTGCCDGTPMVVNGDCGPGGRGCPTASASTGNFKDVDCPPTQPPTHAPTFMPTVMATNAPTGSPTTTPTRTPTRMPSAAPTSSSTTPAQTPVSSSGSTSASTATSAALTSTSAASSSPATSTATSTAAATTTTRAGVPTPAPAPNASPPGGFSPEAVIGIVSGVLALCCSVVGGVVYFKVQKRRQQRDAESNVPAPRRAEQRVVRGESRRHATEMREQRPAARSEYAIVPQLDAAAAAAAARPGYGPVGAHYQRPRVQPSAYDTVSPAAQQPGQYDAAQSSIQPGSAGLVYEAVPVNPEVAQNRAAGLTDDGRMAVYESLGAGGGAVR